MAGARNRIKKNPYPEPTISTAWWNNAAFYTTMHSLRGLVQGLFAGAVASLAFIALSAPGIAGFAFLACTAGFTIYSGVAAHDRAVKADKPKVSKGAPEPYDPQKSAEILQTKGMNVPTPAAPSAPATAPAAPAMPAGVAGSLPPGVALARDDTASSARAELAGLNARYQDALRREQSPARGPEETRYQDAIRRERDMAEGTEISRGGRS